MSTIEFNASFWRLSTDAEGESTLTLKIPACNLQDAADLTQMKGQHLIVSVTTEQDAQQQDDV